MSKNVIIGLVIAVVVIGGGAWYMMMQKSPSVSNESSPQVMEDSSPVPVGTTASDSAMSTGSTKEFTVTSAGLKFDQTNLTVKKGDTVKITYKNTVGTHDFIIDEFKVGTKRIGAGQSETVEFVADQAGSFQFYCSVPGHRQAGMVGTLTVTE